MHIVILFQNICVKCNMLLICHVGVALISLCLHYTKACVNTAGITWHAVTKSKI